MAFVMSPSGAMFPATPGNVAAYGEGKVSSNVKPEKKMDAVKVDVKVEEVESLKVKLDAEVEARIEKEREMEHYRAEMGRMQEHLMIIEKLLEDKEGRFEQELGAEREVRRELEDRLRGFENASNPMNHGDLEERELEVRKRELVLAEKKLDARENDNDVNDFECCLSIPDPSGDVLCDLSMLRSLEDSLKSEKTSVTTIAGLLDNALLKNDELRQILQSVDKFSVRFILQRFKTKFKSLCKISKASMSVVTILVMGKINPDKTRAAVKYAGCRFKRELLREVTSVSKSGEVPVLDMSFKMMVLSDLPGIAELLSTTNKAAVDEHWKVLEDFVVGSMCVIKDVKKKLETATAVLEEYCGKQMADAGNMLAAFNNLFDICTSWLGSPIEGDFQKIQRFLKKCPESVQYAYADHISNPKNDGVRIDELSMHWAEFESMIQTVWESSMIKERVRSGFSEIVVPKTYDLPPSYAAAAASARPVPPARAAEPVIEHVGKIDCDECAKSFSPSMRQIQKFEEQRIPLPTKCPKCKGQICDKYKEDGECPYGDACKFLHPISASGEANVVPTATDDGLKKHSYSCRFYATGACMSGDQCRFQHGPPKAGVVMNIAGAEPVFYTSEVDVSIRDTPKGDSLDVEKNNRFHTIQAVDTSEYRYI